jgi:hypothetical protein
MNNPPAFPSVFDHERGMTLRDYFAARAIGITASNKPPAYDDKTIAKYAYEIADAMLKAREA